MESTDHNGVAPTIVLHPPWKELVRVGSAWDFGSLHLHEEIAAIMGIPYRIGASVNPEYYIQVKRASIELMEEHGKLLRVVQNVGYEVLVPCEQDKHHVRESLKQSRKMRKEYENMAFVPTAEMSNSQVRVHEETRTLLGRAYSGTVTPLLTAKHVVGIASQKILSHAEERRKGEAGLGVAVNGSTGSGLQKQLEHDEKKE